MSHPFHPGHMKHLASTRRFCVGLLGCKEGRARQPGEQSTRFLQEASGNAIEMTVFRHLERVFTA